MSDSTETHFTPGPWASETGEDGAHTISSVDGTAVAFWVQPNNRHVIKAAPALYAALEQIVLDWDGEPEDMFAARAALAKARGETK